MRARFLNHWLGDIESLRVIDEASLSLVRRAVRQHGERLALPPAATEKLVTLASELAHNQLRHAIQGMIGLRAVRRQGVNGLEVVAADRGGGLLDPAAALSGKVTDSPGLGFGLASACDLADEVDIDVRLAEGTCIWARKFAQPIAASQLAIYSRKCQGEDISGDEALFVRSESGLLVAVADGLGHGFLAREAAEQAVTCLRRSSLLEPAQLLVACVEAMASTRGASMTVVRVDFQRALLHYASVGDVCARVYGSGPVQVCSSGAGVLGRNTPKISSQTVPFGPGQRLLLTTDGLSSRLQLETFQPGLSPLVLAHQLLQRYGRPHDDAPHYIEREEAERAAWSAPGVVHIVNRIQVVW